MVRENRIKQVTLYPKTTVIGSVISANYIENPINGEILKLRFGNITSPGSVWIIESGIDVEIYRKNDFTSGLSDFEVYPFVYGVDSYDTTGSPQAYTNYVTNNVLAFVGSGFTSGTSTEFGPVTLYYR